MVYSTAKDLVATEGEGEQCTAIAVIAGYAEGVGTVAGGRASPVDSFLPSKPTHTVKVPQLNMMLYFIVS